MRIAYEKQEDSVKIWGCFAYGNTAELPEQIEGCPVTELAPYAFSDHVDKNKLEEGLKSGKIHLWGEGEAPALRGMELHTLYLPRNLRRIGAYAFYNCNALEELHFYGRLSDLGAGLFTGCHHIRQLEVTLEEEETTCLQEILMEVPEQLSVVMHGKVEAKLIFPEFFEEGVENTPARILVTQMHGSGINYRNCFYQRKFDFQAYDRGFFRARAQESFDTVLDMALCRLLFPWKLDAEGRMRYEGWIREQLPEAGKKVIQRKNAKLLIWLTENFVLKPVPDRELINILTDEAGKAGFTEGAGYLLDLLHRYFKPGAKSFEL